MRPFSVLRPVLFASLLASAVPPAAAETDYDIVGREIAGMLQNRHYAKLPFDAELSREILSNYLDDLDPARLLFTKRDVAGFEAKFGNKLHELLLRRKSMDAATEVYRRLEERVKERSVFVKSVLKESEFTFEENDSILASRKKAERPESLAAARTLWLQRLRGEVLAETVRRQHAAGKEAPAPAADAGAVDRPIAELIEQKYERVLRHVTAAASEDIADFFFSAVASTYDPHTDYMSTAEQERFLTRMSNSLVGIGVTLREEDDGSVRVEAIVIDGPADRSGNLQLNDRIVGVDTENRGGAGMVDIRYQRIDRVVSLIKGKEKTRVRLKVKPAEGEPNTFKYVTIERGKVQHKGQLAKAELIVSKDPERGAPRIGWLEIPSFYYDFRNGKTSVSRDVQALLGRLTRERIEGLVIDLRGNGGGALDEVVRIAGYFLGPKPVVQVRDSRGRVQTQASDWERPLYTGSLVVLTDKASASASEILTGALQDYNRAVVVGSSSTYGKGTVQAQLDVKRFLPVFADGRRAGVLKPTIQKYYRVSGSSVQLVGVQPDVVLPSRYDGFEFGERHLRNPLPHDTVKKSQRFTPLKSEDLHRERLTAQSKERVAGSRDFQYMLSDIERSRTFRAENRISLNLAERLAEEVEQEKRVATRRVERKERFARLVQADADQFDFYELRLEDVAAKELPKIGPDRERSEYLRRASDEDAGEALTWPNGMSPAKRESIAVVTDLIRAREASKLAGKTPKA